MGSITTPPLDCKNESANRFYAYGVIARLALLASARELNEVNSAN